MARPKGVPNKDKQTMLEKAKELGCDPFHVLCLFANKDKSVVQNLPDDEVIKYQFGAAKELAQYIYAKRSAVKLTADEDSGFKIIIEDYTSKDSK